MNSPSARSKALLRESWPFVDGTERWIPGANVRRDLFGFCDILCLNGDLMLAVQTTTSSHVMDRYEKLRHMPVVVHWLSCAHRQIHIHGWSKRGPAGKRKVWTCRSVALYLDPDGQVQMAEPERAEAA